MANQQLLDYIESQRQKGLSDDVIREALLRRGWQEKTVNEGFEQSMPGKELESSTPEVYVELPKAPTSPSPISPVVPPLSMPAQIKPVAIGKKKGGFKAGRWLLISLFLIMIGAGSWYGYQKVNWQSALNSIGKLSGKPVPSPTPTADQHRQDIQKKAIEMLERVNKREYVEALSYFDIKGQPNLTYDDILSFLAAIKTNYQVEGKLQYDIPVENIQINGETAVVVVNLSTNSGNHQVFLDYHYSYWHITNVRFEEGFDYLLTKSPVVAEELYGIISFEGFLSSYALSGEDKLIISQIDLDKTQKALVFKTAAAATKNYLLAVYEPYFNRQYIPITAGEQLNYTLPLTTSSYGVIYMFENAQGQPVNQETIPYLINADPMLWLTFKVK